MADSRSSGWSLLSATSEPRVFSRPLGLTETGFFWDSMMNGTADTITHYVIQTSPSLHMTRDRFAQTWTAARRHFPLLGASVEEKGSDVQFLVEEATLGSLTNNNFDFRDISSDQEADDFVEGALNGPRILSPKTLSKCVIFRRTDEQHVFHVIFIIAHLITDGMANYSLVREFLNTLASEPATPRVMPDLVTRLRMVPSQESLMPVSSMSVPRQRWRKAIAFALWQGYQRTMTGGHTIPNRITPDLFFKPAKSRHVHIRLPEAVSERISKTCRANDITVGHAHPILAQLGLSRVLHRRFARGELPKEEWERRLREPTHTGGPLNLRSFLSPDWVQAGGAEEVNLCISFFFTTMPFMPGAANAPLDTTGAPAFADTLSHGRFFLRAQSVKAQVTQFLRHPLFLEMTLARAPGRVERVRDSVRQWKAIQEGQALPPVPPSGPFGLVMQNGGSSFGRVDALLPPSYPSKVTGLAGGATSAVSPADASEAVVRDAPTILLRSTRTHLRCRPAELYLGCSTLRGQMIMNVFYDGNAFADDVVAEWLHEIVDAAVHYLGQPETGTATAAKL